MVGIMLLVFIRSDIYDAVRDVDAQSVGTGLLGRLVRRCCSVFTLTCQSDSFDLVTLIYWFVHGDIFKHLPP